MLCPYRAPCLECAACRAAYGIIARRFEGNSLTRLYYPGEIAAHGECRVTAGQAHHVIQVLRLQVGAELTLFDGCGAEYPARIRDIGKSGVILAVTGRREVSRESPLGVVLAQGISSGERMDYTVQKCVELGVAAIQPLTTQRSVVRLSGERADKRLAHWHAIAAAACEQCGRNRLPAIHPVQPLMTWLSEPSTADRYVLSPHAAASLRDLPRPAGVVTLLVGPEGGWDPAETAAAQRAGYTAMRLGPRVLRTETAAVAALAAMQARWGDF